MDESDATTLPKRVKDQHQSVKDWYSYLGSIGAFQRFSFDYRSAIARETAQRRWELRRLRYGPTGQRPKPYSQWKQAHGKEAPKEESS